MTNNKTITATTSVSPANTVHMVNLCYVLAATAAIPLTEASNFQRARFQNQVVLMNTRVFSPNNLPHLIRRDQHSKPIFDVPKVNLQNKAAYNSYPIKVENNKEPESKSEDDRWNYVEPTEVNSYAFRRLQKKTGVTDRKFDMPINVPVPSWNNQNHHNDDTSIANQVEAEGLKDMLDYYLDMGKEKWAGFLATSNCNQFQKLLKKLKRKMGDDHNDDKEEEDEEEEYTIPIKKPSHGSKAAEEEDGKNAENTEGPEDAEDAENAEGAEGIEDNDSNYDDDDDDDYFYEDEDEEDWSVVENTRAVSGLDVKNEKPGLLNLPEEELNNFQEMLNDVISFWESKDAKSILEASKGLSYEEFELDDDDYSSVKHNQSEFKETKNVSVYDVNGDAGVKEGDNRDKTSEYTKHNPEHRDLLESLEPETVKTQKQKKWLRDNAVRRAKIIQALLNGHFDEYNLQQDIIKYRDSNIFLDQDENEFINSGNKIGSKNIAMYVFIAVEALMFQIL